jgi:hypothetical protein
MRTQFARHARRVSSALLVALFAALLLVPSSSQPSSAGAAGVHPAVRIAQHSSDAALVSHTTRPTTVHHGGSGLAVDSDAAAYPPALSWAAEPAATATRASRLPETSRARAPPADATA